MNKSYTQCAAYNARQDGGKILPLLRIQLFFIILLHHNLLRIPAFKATPHPFVSLKKIQIPPHGLTHAKKGVLGQTLVDFGPEAVLEDFLCLLQALVVLETIQVGQNSHHLGESMDLYATADFSLSFLTSERKLPRSSSHLEKSCKCGGPDNAKTHGGILLEVQRCPLALSRQIGNLH